MIRTITYKTADKDDCFTSPTGGEPAPLRSQETTQHANVDRQSMSSPYSSRVLPLLVITAVAVMRPLLTYGVIQTTREYELQFNYDPKSSKDPPKWDRIDAKEHGWADVTVFMNTKCHDLKIDGNECASTRRQSPVNLYPVLDCDHEHVRLERIVTLKSHLISCLRACHMMIVHAIVLRSSHLEFCPMTGCLHGWKYTPARSTSLMEDFSMEKLK